MNSAPLTIVIVGGVAGGASAATRARRMNEDAEIIIIEKDRYVSFANCGLPYYIGGEITDRSQLLVATPAFLSRRFRLDVRTGEEVTKIDRKAKKVAVLKRATGESYEQPYNKLILTPGASPIIPPIEGSGAAGVFVLRNLDDADRIRAAVDRSRLRRAVIVGAGYIGIEAAEQLKRREFHVAIAELQPQVLPLFDAEMAGPVEKELRGNGIELHLGDGIKRVMTGGDGAASGVELESGATIKSDIVLLAMGVRPNLDLAKDAGLAIGPGGGISTDEFLRTSDPDIYVAGDAAEITFGPTGRTRRIALAGPANRAGRLAGEHAATGKSAPMAAVCGTCIVRVFRTAAALTGLSVKEARRLGVEARSVTIAAAHHAGYYPGAARLTLKLVFEPQTGKVLGAQVVGCEGVDKRIDVIATAMAMGATVRDLAGLDLAYAPQFSSAKDPVHLAAFAACNESDGIEEFAEADADLGGVQVVDVRSPDEVARSPLAGAGKVINIPLDELRARIGELDPGRKTVVSCGVGLRAHVAARILRQRGFKDVKNLSGGALVRNRTLSGREKSSGGIRIGGGR